MCLATSFWLPISEGCVGCVGGGGASGPVSGAVPMFVFSFSAGVPAFTQPEQVHEALSEGVAPLPKQRGGCKALQVRIALANSNSS